MSAVMKRPPYVDIVIFTSNLVVMRLAMRVVVGPTYSKRSPSTVSCMQFFSLIGLDGRYQATMV